MVIDKVAVFKRHIMNDESDREKHPETWRPRKGEKRQSLVNRLGALGLAIAAGIAIYIYQGISEKFKEMNDTIKVSKMNTEMIKRKRASDVKKVGVLHERIEKNEDAVAKTREELATVAERSKINRRDIEIMEIKRKY